MQYDIIPLNGNLLLKRATIEVGEKKNDGVTFLFQEATTSETEYFEVVSLAKECGYDIHVGNVITVENYRPLGQINGEQMYVCDYREVSCSIKPKNEIRDTK